MNYGAYSNLPDDIDALRAIIAAQADQLAEQARKLQSRDTLIDKLKAQLAVLKRARFGSSSGEDGPRHRTARTGAGRYRGGRGGSHDSLSALGAVVVIRRGKPGLVAHVLIARYCDHLPLYCQSEIYAREGVDLSRSTMADWIGKASTLLEPLLVKISKHVFAGHRLHGDDAPVPVLEPGKGETMTG